ncbi:Tetratricopeptide repeat/TIR domain-containing protein [Frankia sp. AiPs1]|uniref:tetratricopeptide repeat protein n=1 Tax=Frankia sp. AiPa1 TaxID=573492 RepID=UPI00202B24C2|nr:tetratricopeptide repeat protein [Frankia sp. AiPa1]MCL9762818.1 tetratricopeptide repeat protein [Frankia sp. AiPa1]
MTFGGEGDAVDCFVSYAGDGQPWAEWISAALEGAGHRVANHAWDVVPGTHVVVWLDRMIRQAGCTIAVVSDDYLDSAQAQAEWGAAWSPPVDGTAQRPLLVARVTERPIPGLLGQIAPIDLVGRGESAAESVLLGAVRASLGRESPGAGESGLVRFPGAAARPVYPAELPAVWNVPRPAARFLGRADDLAQLDTALAGSGLVAVTGLAGIGKTSLAAEFVSQHRLDYQAVWWVPAGRPELVGQQVRALAPALGLPSHAEPAAVLAHLDMAGGRWLLVLDDLADAADLPGWLRPSEGAGRVLATSRGSTWDWERQLSGPWNGQVLGLRPLPRAESVALLADRLPGLDAALADRVATHLGDHPQALDQAAHQIIDIHGDADGFLAGLERAAVPLAALGDRPVPGRPETTIATQWDEAIRRLDADNPAAATLVRLAAHGDSTRLPLRLLTAEASTGTSIGGTGTDTDIGAGTLPGDRLRAVAADPLALAATTAALERTGLAHRDGSAVAMHPLVRAAVRAQTTPEQAADLVDGLGRMLHAALPETVTAHPESWPAWRELLPHALAVLDATAPSPEAPHAPGAPPAGTQPAEAPPADIPPADTVRTDTAHTAWLAEHAAAYLLEQGHPEQAEPLAARAVAAREHLDGPRHPDTLAARDVHIRTALAADHLTVAGPLAERNAADRERLLGPEHPDTLASRETLARAYQQAGHLDHAHDLITRNLADRERILGPEHPDTLESRHRLGTVLDDTGRGDDAARVLRPTLTTRDRVLGPEHPDTLTTRYQLATTYQRMGAVGDALAHAEPALEARTRVLGPDHPATLDSRHGLGVTYEQAGRTADATRELNQTLTGRDRILGPDHRRTLDSADALGRIHRRTGQPELALPLFDRAATGRDQVLGPDHSASVQSREQLAAVFVAMDRPAEAIPHLERVLDRHERVLGPAHSLTIEAREKVADQLLGAGQPEAARHHLERQLVIRAHTAGANDERTLRTAATLAETCRRTGRLPEAVHLSERVHTGRTDTLGPDHPETRASRFVLADTYRQAGRHADAASLDRANLADSTREHGPFHPDTVRARLSLADAPRPEAGEPRPPERPAAPEPRFLRPGP